MNGLTSRCVVSLFSIFRQTVSVKVSVTFVVHVSEKRAVEGIVVFRSDEVQTISR